MDSAGRVGAWISGLLNEWRRAWDNASYADRRRVEGSCCFLPAPTQCWVYLRADSASPVTAAFLLFRRDPHRPDGEVRRLRMDGTGKAEGDAPPIGWLLERLEAYWANMRANWSLGRPADPAPEPWQVGRQQVDGDLPATL